MSNIIEFIKDAAKALVSIKEFIKGFFDFFFSFVNLIPSPFNNILSVAGVTISAIIIYKLIRS